MASKKLKSLLVTVGIVLLAYIYNKRKDLGQGPVVGTSTGKLQGILSKSRGGRQFHEFRGIPYAEPPIGNLRFEPPQPKTAWNGVKDASRLGSVCLQANIIANSSALQGSEDCLFLNVFAPRFTDTEFSTTPLPVMVFIHGGYFMGGSADFHTPQYFMDEDVVLVTLNYRLASLGFLNTGDGVVRGNMGLKDQTLALQWVQTNIHKFGGNPRNCILFGESAGGSSVHFHMLSAMSKGLFSGAIAQSGTANKPSALASRPREQALRLAKMLNCSTEDSTEMVRCLKELKAEDIITVHREASSPIYHPLRQFAPTVEEFYKDAKDTFISDLPINIMRNGGAHKVPWILGVNSEEGLLLSGRIMHSESLIHEFESNTDTLFPQIFAYDEVRTDVAPKLREFYFGTKTGFMDAFANYTNLFSDTSYNYGVKEAALLHSQLSPTYLYYNNYETESSIVSFFSIRPGSIASTITQILYMKAKEWFIRTVFGIQPKRYGVCHGDELFIQFQFQMAEVGETSKDFEMSKNLVNLWAQFANNPSAMQFYGKPWLPIKPTDKTLQYLQLSNERSANGMIDEPFTKRIDFLMSLNIR